MSNTQHSPFASPYSYSPPGAITTPNNLACTIVSEGGTDFYTVVVPAAGTFDAGANPMTLTTIYPGLLAKIVNNQAGDFLVKGSKAGDPGVLCLAGATTVVTDDGNGNLMEVANSSTSGSSGTGPLFTSALVRGVVDANVANLAAFTCSGAGRDGITYAPNDLVLLMNQTTASQNGPYVVGAVVANVAPLTRPPWWAAGSTIPSEFTFQAASDGTLYGGLRVRTSVQAKVVDTDDPVLRFVSVGASIPAAGTAATFIKGIGAYGHNNGTGIYTFTNMPIGIDLNKSTVKLTNNSGNTQMTFVMQKVSATSLTVITGNAGVAGDIPFDLEISYYGP